MEKDLKNIALFENDPVRRVWHNEQWYFAIVDVVRVLTGSVQPDGYIKDMRRRDEELSKGWGANCHPPFGGDQWWYAEN